LLPVRFHAFPEDAAGSGNLLLRPARRRNSSSSRGLHGGCGKALEAAPIVILQAAIAASQQIRRCPDAWPADHLSMRRAAGLFKKSSARVNSR
jgi:hypothetical protein